MPVVLSLLVGLFASAYKWSVASLGFPVWGFEPLFSITLAEVMLEFHRISGPHIDPPK